MRIHIRKHIPQSHRWWGFYAGKDFTKTNWVMNLGFGKYFLAARTRKINTPNYKYRFLDFSRKKNTAYSRTH